MPGKRKLLFVLHSLTLGGAESLVCQLSLSLKDEYEIGICCLDYKGAMWDRCAKEGFALYVVDRKPGINLSTFQKCRRVVADFNPDIIHAHHYTPYFYSVCAKLLSLSSAKVIFTEHGRHYPDAVSFRRRIVNKVLIRFTFAVTAVCGFTKKSLVSKEGIPEGKIEVIYNGLYPGRENADIDLKSKLGIPEEDPVVGYIGSLRSVKNPRFLFEAFVKVKSSCPNCHLVFIGDGPLREELAENARNSGLGSSVHFTGATPFAAAYLKYFDVFVLPSLSEAASLALLEAMSFGLPVVATDRGGSSEIVHDGINGLLVRSMSEEELAEKILHVIHNPEHARKLGEAAAKTVKERFTFEGMLRRYRDIYDRKGV